MSRLTYELYVVYFHQLDSLIVAGKSPIQMVSMTLAKCS